MNKINKLLFWLIMIMIIVILKVYSPQVANNNMIPEDFQIGCIEYTDEASKTVVIKDREEIEKIRLYILKGTKTKELSVDDRPNEEHLYTITISNEGGFEHILLYAYKKKKVQYIEKPYDGIYKMDMPLEEVVN